MTAPATKLLPRGVCYADYLIGGCPVLLAIDSRGNCIKRVRVSPKMDEDCAWVWLEGIIEHYDPPLPARPHLSLVSFPPAPKLTRGAFLASIRPRRQSRDT